MEQNELKEQILETATDLFRRKGLKFTMQDVASEMHVAKKTIYTIYTSKEELLMDLVETGFQRIQDVKREVLESDLPLKEKISTVLIAMPENYRTLDFRRLTGMDEKYPEVSARIAEHLKSEWEPIIEILQEGMQKGYIYPISIPVLKQMVTSSIDSFMYSNELVTSGITYQEALNEMVTIIMNGVWNDKTE